MERRRGLQSYSLGRMPAADVNQQVVVDKIEQLNKDPNIHGILVQLPLPHSFDIARILHTISADKDVDGSTCIMLEGSWLAVRCFRPARLMAW